MWLQVVAARDQKWRVASDKSDLLSLLRQFRTKIGGGLGQRSIRKEFGALFIFLQPLKLATSNLVQRLKVNVKVWTLAIASLT